MNEVLDVGPISRNVNPTNLALLGPPMEQTVAWRTLQRHTLDVGGPDYAHRPFCLGSLQCILLHPQLPLCRGVTGS